MVSICRQKYGFLLEKPILFGEDAHRFEARMKNPPKETVGQRNRRLKNYHIMMAALEADERDRREGKLPLAS